MRAVSGRMAVEPLAHSLGLLQAFRGEPAAEVGLARFRFGMTPEDRGPSSSLSSGSRIAREQRFLRRARARARRAVPDFASSSPSGVKLPGVARVGEVRARDLRRRRACAARGRAPGTRPRCGGTGCGPSSPPTRARRRACRRCRRYQTRWCSRKRPRIERTRMFSDSPGTPGRSAHAPRTMRSISTPACDAAYSARITPSSRSAFILATMRAGLPCARVPRFAPDHLHHAPVHRERREQQAPHAPGRARLVMCRNTSLTSAQIAGSAVSSPKSV